MRFLDHDAKSFVQGVVSYLRSEGKASSAVPKVSSFLRKVTGSARHERQATVESAVALSLAEKTQLSRVLSTIIGHSLTFRYRVNRQVLAGLRVVVADWIVDTSLSGQLTTMASSLKE